RRWTLPTRPVPRTSSRPGPAGRSSRPTSWDTPLRCTTAASTCRSSSPSRWSATSWGSSPRPAPTAGTTRTTVRHGAAEAPNPASRIIRQVRQESMEAKAQARYVRVTPLKARRVVDNIRGQRATEAVSVLRFAPQAAAETVRKVVESAIANARVKADQAGEAFDENALVISAAYVDEGPTLKRFRPRAKGSASRILKRTSHITVCVGDDSK